ncbi:MAG: patatin-like phospholipase family protein [Pseudomonadota bacterium]
MSGKIRWWVTRQALCLVVLAAPGLSAACDHDDADGRPDVALVLSGGGALVSTQIGALQEIEALGVPIHCVVGSSMGAVVGALYAAGYSADELATMFVEDDWGAIFRGDVSRRDGGYLRKEQDDRYLSNYVVGVDGNGVRLPRGLRSMSGLQAHFRALTGHLPGSLSFDDLRVPYRAMAMDLSTGAAVPLAQGDLVQAMLASMAVPGVFPARTIDGRTYVDGGMAAQLPVAAARALGAELIIALDTTIEPPELGPDAAITDVTQQLVRLTVWQNWLRDTALLGDEDLMIRPDLTGLNTSSFYQAAIGLRSGRSAAQQAHGALRAIARKAAPSRARPLPRSPRLPLTARIAFDEAPTIAPSVLKRRLQFAVDDVLDPLALQAKLSDLRTFGGFNDVDLVVRDGQARVHTEPNALGRNLLQAGLRASNNFEGDSTFALQGQFTRRPFSQRGGELRLDVELGTDLGLSAELYQPFGPEGRFFVTPGVAYRGEQILFDIADVRLAEFWQQSVEGRLRFGRELKRWGVLAVETSYTAGRIKPKVTVDPETFATFDYRQAGVGLLFGVDTLDRPAWPLAGAALKVSAERLFALNDTEPTNRYGFSLFKPLDLGSVGLGLRLDTQSVDNRDDQPVEVLSLGGFRRITALPENSVPNNRYALASLEVFRRLTSTRQIVSVPVYLGATLEYAEVDLDIFAQGEEESILAGSVYLGAETVLGPFLLGVGVGSDDAFSVFLHFGRGF